MKKKIKNNIFSQLILKIIVIIFVLFNTQIVALSMGSISSNASISVSTTPDLSLEYSSFFGNGDQVFNDAMIIDKQGNIIISGWAQNEGSEWRNYFLFPENSKT